MQTKQTVTSTVNRDDNSRSYIYDLSPADLKAWLAAHGYPAYRYGQVNHWLVRGATAAAEMTDLPQNLREDLAAAFFFDGLRLSGKYESARDGTVKYTAKTADEQVVEFVFMPYQKSRAVCVSSQVGCLMGCRFCASTGAGFGRNLTAGEMFAQVILAGRDRDLKIDHVTVMGIGEPLANLAAVLEFIKRLNSAQGLNISMRKITVSTCGLVPEINQLAAADLPITLAVSLHAPNDRLRRQIMPVANRYPLTDLMLACRAYQEQTGRRMTYEYALFHDFNDRPAAAVELANLLKKQLCHVNLIPANEIPGGHFRRAKPEAVRRFQKILTDRRIACTVRREMGADISAACGQLRRAEL